MTENIIAQKKELRRKFLEIRSAIPNDIRAHRSQQIVQQLYAHLMPQLEPQTIVGLYWPIHGEVDVMRLARLFPNQLFALPKMHTHLETMEFHLYKHGDPLQENKWGVPEPVQTPEHSAPVIEPHILIVPGIAFAKGGQRIGYGKGFYDKYLQAHHATTIGVCFAKQIASVIPQQPHDHRVRTIITESETYNCNPIW